jgi:hypothetical protein
MTWTQHSLATLVLNLVRRLHRRLEADETGQLPIFRDQTVRMLQRAIKESAPQLAGTPAAETVAQLELELRGINPDDLRTSRCLRSQIAEVVGKAEEELWSVVTNTKLEEQPT